MAEKKVKVHIKSLPYFPRGKAGEYRAGSVQILDASEAYELDKAGIAIIVEDPYLAPVENENPYLQPEASPEAPPAGAGEGGEDGKGDDSGADENSHELDGRESGEGGDDPDKDEE